MNKLDSLIAPQTKEFVKLCRKYFEYLDKLPDKKISDFWTAQLRLLPEIYGGIYRLPQIDARYSSDVEKFVTEREYNRIFINLVSFIGSLDKFADFSDLSHPGTMKVINASAVSAPSRATRFAGIFLFFFILPLLNAQFSMRNAQ